MPRDPFLDQSQDGGVPQVPSLKGGQRLFNHRYELVRLLGAGGMGVVWLARDHTEEAEVALKFLPAVLVLQEGEMKRLREEVRAGKELRHPRLVATYALEVEDAVAAIVMEFVPGQSLLQKLEGQERGFFEPEEIAGWVKDMTDGLQYLHDEARRIHRDLKPANVMIDEQGRARLMDFGISHRIKEGVSRHSKTSDGQAGGSSSTLAYASPQQITGKPSARADDIYSLGATVYELLTGTPPFFRGGIDAVRGQIKDEPAVPIMERRAELVEEGLNRDAGRPVNEGIEREVLACLAKEREKRPASAAVLCQSFSAPSSGAASREKPATADAAADAEARKRAALDEKRRDEEREMAEERKRARLASEQRTAADAARQRAATNATARQPEADDMYGEYLRAADTPGGISLRYLPVSPRGAWADREREAQKLLPHRAPGHLGIQAASSVLTAFAFVKKHSLEEGMMLCCEVRPDHVCCSWMEFGDGVYEELGSWSIDSAGLTADRVAARIWSSCEAMRAHIPFDPRQIGCCGISHACEFTRARARELARHMPGKVWLWEDDVAAAIAGAQDDSRREETLLLCATPYPLSLRLPDQTLLPIMQRFTTIPKQMTVDAVWKHGGRRGGFGLELVEETDRGTVPIKSQAVAASVCSIQGDDVRTRITVDCDAVWRLTVQLSAPPSYDSPPPAPAAAPAVPPPPPPPPGPAAAPPPRASGRAGLVLGGLVALLLVGWRLFFPPHSRFDDLPASAEDLMKAAEAQMAARGWNDAKAPEAKPPAKAAETKSGDDPKAVDKPADDGRDIPKPADPELGGFTPGVPK